MHIHYLQHVSFEGLGSMEPWLAKEGRKITATHLYESEKLPDLEDLDMLIVMGGPMSVNDEGRYPWFGEEKRFIRKVIESGKPVLGVCLGAQLIANAMGSKVYPNSEKEIGWFPVKGIPTDNPEIFQFPPSLDAFHWHGETFDLPDGAKRLASSEACKNQAFQIGSTVIGLQFHLEMTPASIKALATHCRDELIPSTYIQTEREILSATQKKYDTTNKMMGNVLSFMTSK